MSAIVCEARRELDAEVLVGAWVRPREEVAKYIFPCVADDLCVQTEDPRSMPSGERGGCR